MQQREADRLDLGRVGIRPDPARLARIRLTGRWGDRWVPRHQTMARAPVSAVRGQPRMVRRALQTQTEFRRMPFGFFHTRFPEVAKRETRTVLIFGNSGYGLPPAHYSFLEMFRDEIDKPTGKGRGRGRGPRKKGR